MVTISDGHTEQPTLHLFIVSRFWELMILATFDMTLSGLFFLVNFLMFWSPILGSWYLLRCSLKALCTTGHVGQIKGCF